MLAMGDWAPSAVAMAVAVALVFDTEPLVTASVGAVVFCCCSVSRLRKLLCQVGGARGREVSSVWDTRTVWDTHLLQGARETGKEAGIEAVGEVDEGHTGNQGDDQAAAA